MNDEIVRWQQAIYELCQEHYPDVDGSGCDSGDELDLTLAEIQEVFNMYQDQIDDMKENFKEIKDLLGNISILSDEDEEKSLERIDEICNGAIKMEIDNNDD